MKNLVTVTLFFGLSILSFGQNKIDYIPLSSFSPDANNDDLKQLDTFFQNKQIIGIGESTHGTSEFTTMRHRLFKYLVEYHQFNTFFLEADYNACKRVNRYIHGAEDNVDSALVNVVLWPWMTKEMTTLIDWMRLYNTENGNKLNFVGCDMQLIEDERKELELFFNGNKEILIKVDKMLTAVNDGRNRDSVSVKNAFSEWNAILELTKTEASNDWKLIKKGIDQWFDNHFQGHYNLRDSCMAENMLYYSTLYPETKGIYFAHNWHISKYRRDYKKYPSIKSTGYYLQQKLTDNYYTIAQLTYEAAFTVGDFQKREMVTAERLFNSKKHLENKLHRLNASVLFTQANIKKDFQYKIGSIGAAIGTLEGKILSESEWIQKTHFDAILFIDKTTPTRLLKKITFK